MKRCLISVLTLVFVLGFCLPGFAFDEIAFDEIEISNSQERDFIKQEYAYACILSNNLIQYQTGSNNRVSIKQAGTGNYLKIQQSGNSNTAVVIQH